jgi:hypothetical protein
MDPTELPDIGWKQIQLAKRCLLGNMMDKAQKPSNPEHYAPSAEPFMFYFEKILFTDPPTSTISITCSLHVQWPVTFTWHHYNFTAYSVKNKALKSSIFWDITL